MLYNTEYEEKVIVSLKEYTKAKQKEIKELTEDDPNQYTPREAYNEMREKFGEPAHIDGGGSLFWEIKRSQLPLGE